MKSLKNHNNKLNVKDESEIIKKAFEFAKNAHEGQKRFSGEPYINHPLRVAKIVKDLKLSDKAVAAAILHDVPEDTDKTIEDIKKNFGKEISFLVEGVTKLGRLRYPKDKFQKEEKPTENELENLRKTFFAMGEDIRVIIIKLADRLDNMRTLEYVPEEKKPRLAFETMEIFAPIANRLGMGKIKGELEDLAFQYLYPNEFQYIKKILDPIAKQKEKYLNKVKRVILQSFSENKIKPLSIDSRIKHYWSFYKKLKKHNMQADKIYDVVALRIIMENKEDCYKALGIIHQLWKPLPGRIKDYIALPKPNGYQSLHTTVFCINGVITEIQIRTMEMHLEAEYGVCSHWSFKENVNIKKAKKKFRWIQQLNEWLKNTKASKELIEGFKLDFLKERIFVFTPNGKVIDLPEGATPVDFAYAIHTEIGNKCSKAKVNGKIVPLSHPLSNWDVVEIFTDKNRNPSPDWLQFVKTRSAKARIKDYLNKERAKDYIKSGQVVIDNELLKTIGKKFSKLSKKEISLIYEKTKTSSLDDLMMRVGKGEISPSQISDILLKKSVAEDYSYKIKNIFRKKKTDDSLISTEKITFGSGDNISFTLSKCCNPKSGDNIVAFITKDRGATIHKNNCIIVKDIKSKWPERIIDAEWSEIKPTRISFEIEVKDDPDIFKKIFDIIKDLNIEIIENSIKSIKNSKNKIMHLKIKVPNIKCAKEFISMTENISGVMNIKRDKKSVFSKLFSRSF